MPTVLVGQCRTDLVGRLLEKCSGQTPAGTRRCADTDERDVCAQYGGARIGSDGEVAGGNDLGDEVADFFLNDR